jgi:hypothetical protein
MRFRSLPALIAACTLATCVALGQPGVAAAGGLPPAVVDCHAHSKLTRHYSASELRVALALMPPDITEYTDCYDVIERQLLSEIGSQRLTDAGGTSGGSFLPTPVLVAIIVLALGAAILGVVALGRRKPPAG